MSGRLGPGLVESNEDRTKRLTMLTENALTYLRLKKSVSLGTPMDFIITELVDAARKVDPEKKGIHRCNFSRSDDLRRLVMGARGQSETLPAVPDFEDLAALRFSKQRVQVRSGRRRAELAKYPHRKLAFLLAGLEELERHYLARLDQLEKLWPDFKSLVATDDYPMVPFQAGPNSVKRYERYVTRTPVKVLVDLIVRREKAVAVIREHVDKYDQRYVELRIGTYRGRKAEGLE